MATAGTLLANCRLHCTPPCLSAMRSAVGLLYTVHSPHCPIVDLSSPCCTVLRLLIGLEEVSYLHSSSTLMHWSKALFTVLDLVSFHSTVLLVVWLCYMIVHLSTVWQWCSLLYYSHCLPFAAVYLCCSAQNISTLFTSLCLTWSLAP